MSALTLEDAFVEFQRAGLAAVDLKGDGAGFLALCPACGGEVTVTPDGGGRLVFKCSQGCPRDRIADELHFRTSREPWGRQEKFSQVGAYAEARAEGSPTVPIPIEAGVLGHASSGPASRFTTRGVDMAQVTPVRFVWSPWLVRQHLALGPATPEIPG